MTQLSRRNLLARSAGATVAAAASALPAIALASADPLADAELLKLGDEYRAAGAEAKRVSAAADEARAQLPEWAQRGLPALPAKNPLFQHMAASYAHDDGSLPLDGIRRFNTSTESIVAEWRDMEPGHPIREKMRAQWIQRRQEGRARVKWWRQEFAAINAEYDRLGILALEAKWEAMCDRKDELAEAIEACPAHTLAGALLKLRVGIAVAVIADGVASEEDIHDGWEHVLGAYRTIERLTGKAA